MNGETEKDKTNLQKTDSDPIGLFDNIINRLLDLNLPSTVLNNIFKSLNQLCSAAIQWPSAFFEGKAAVTRAKLEGEASEIRAETEARIKIIQASGDQIAQKLDIQPEYVRRAGNKFAEKIIREQVNLDMICYHAINELLNNESANYREMPINDDWLNDFENEARSKSTEEMQALFARILAGEIKQPGAYSRRAVKILSQLPQNASRKFKHLCSLCIIIGPPNAAFANDARVPVPNDAQWMHLFRYGLVYKDLNLLNENGLILSNYHTSHTADRCIPGALHENAEPFWYQGQYWILEPMKGWKKTNERFRIWGVGLSEAGRELIHIAGYDPAPNFTKDLKESFAKQKLKMTEVDDPWKHLNLNAP